MQNIEKAVDPHAAPASSERHRKDTPTADPSIAEDEAVEATGGIKPRAVPAGDGYAGANFDEHTTAAHKLLYLWPSIHALVQSARPSSNYVVEREARGPLRLYGQGEADESGASGAFGAASPAHSSASDEVNELSPADAWGPATVLPFETKRSEPFTVGGLASDGRVDLNTHTINRLFESYKRHIHILHPFLDMTTLSRFIEKFAKLYGSERNAPLSPFIGVNGAGDGGIRTGLKRKRSEPCNNSGPSSGDGSSYSNTYRVMPERSLGHAIVYLVLALGKICEHREPLPGPLREDNRVYSMAPPLSQSASGIWNHSPRHAKLSPSSPHGYNFDSTPPVTETFRAGRSRGASVDSPSADKRAPLNVEKIPGLAYYREACSILGDFADSNELGCAQARLLAGLYKGQLARVQESWSWIYDAARICRYRIRL